MPTEPGAASSLRNAPGVSADAMWIAGTRPAASARNDSSSFGSMPPRTVPSATAAAKPGGSSEGTRVPGSSGAARTPGAPVSSSRRADKKSEAPRPSPAAPVAAEDAEPAADPAPSPSITPGSATIKGALDSAAVARTLRKWARAFRRVYERAIKAQGPGFGGRVVFELVVEAGGSVGSVKVVENTTGSSSFASQLVAVAKRFRFAAPSDGQPVTLRCPFVFKPAR